MTKSFGEFLAQKRKENNLTQKELAEKLYVTESAVSKWENDIARPDLSLIPKISEILGVTEHELITASVDEANRKMELQAKKWRKVSSFWNWFFYISYGVALLTCFIVNLSVSKNLTWFFIVLSALTLAASFTSIPQYITKYRIILIPTIEFLSLALLLAVCCIYTDGSWFWITIIPIFVGLTIIFLPIIGANYFPKNLKNHNALFCVTVDFILIWLMLLAFNCLLHDNRIIGISTPIVLVTFVFADVMVLIIRYLKFNGLIKTGLNMFLSTIFFTVIGYTTDIILSKNVEDVTPFSIFKANFSIWSGNYINYNVDTIVFLSFILLGVIFTAVGLIVKNRRK